MNKSEHTVVIIGAGPTGLALGAELKRLGIPSLILDRLVAGANTSRAAAIHARTLEVLEPLGATTELLRTGLIVPTLRIRDKNRLLASISFKKLDTAYPFVLMCPQDRTEIILLQRLEALGGVVSRPCEVIDIQPQENEIQIKYKHDNEVKTIYTKWLIGCDGIHSIVREKTAIPFVGGNYKENFVLADVEMNWPLGQEEVDLFFSEKGLLAIAPLPNNIFRIIATVEQSPSLLSLTDFQQILAERGPQNISVKIERMIWSSRFHIQYRVAKTLRQGRVLLAGDAAHVHSPAGGQGMNTGIQDAITLAAALKETLENGNDVALDKWEKKRLNIAHSVVKLTDRMTRIATASSPSMKFLRNIIIQIIGKISFVRYALAEKLSELNNK